jgi:hypothetical protein
MCKNKKRIWKTCNTVHLVCGRRGLSTQSGNSASTTAEHRTTLNKQGRRVFQF